MNPERDSQPSFSARRRLNCAMHAAVGALAVAALVVMVNYLAGRHAVRWFVSTQTDLRLSPLTLGFLKTLTNRVTVTALYDRDEPFCSTVVALLKEYQVANPRIAVRVVDPVRDAGAAQQLAAKHQLAGTTNKNFIIFDCAGSGRRLVPGDVLVRYSLEKVPNEEVLEFRRKPVAFLGEQMFTAALLAVTSPQPLQAYFLTGHGEHAPDSGDEVRGYVKFAGLLQQNYIRMASLTLLGTNQVPGDCNLLLIAGPITRIPDAELDRIEQYLIQGGRLLALFNSFGSPRESGLEAVLAKWGVEVSPNSVVDMQNTVMKGYDLIAGDFGAHPIVNPLLQSGLHLVRPRSVGRLPSRSQSAEAPKVMELVRSGPGSTMADASQKPPRAFPLAVAVEKGAVPGVVTDRGTTRMVVVGDSMFLGNQMIESARNRDFGGYAVNWLLERTHLMQGLGPRPVAEFRLAMGRTQLQTVEWLLLAGQPGVVLLLGGVVWLRRRR